MRQRPPLIQASGLQKSYSVPVLVDFGFELQAGEVHALIGSNGDATLRVGDDRAELGGTAVADILFGRANPSGRLPITFYTSTEDLPPFEDYRMAGRTYRYFTGRALYPFGHGLSYTRFAYANLRVAPPVTPTPDVRFVATVDVTNSGDRPGEEVVQLYVREPEATAPRAIQSLAGYARIALAPGETRTVRLPVTAQSLRRWSLDKKAYVLPSGEWQVRVGASSADIRETAVIAQP